MTSPVRAVDLVRVASDAAHRCTDRVVAEEPLEIRLSGVPLVVTMRTPGRDRDLAAGFLLSERIVRTVDDIAAIRHCTHPGEDNRVAAPAESAHVATLRSGEQRHNVVDVWLAGEAVERATAHVASRRLVPVTSACGVCGRRSIEDLTHGSAPLSIEWGVTRAAVLAWPNQLRQAQAAFDETGGLHAAALFDPGGAIVGMAEDIGRHNAVDKVVGAELLRERTPLGDRILFVSGRSSFEIVQKAVVAGIPLVAAVSAPSSLAVDLAREAGITLLGFVRGESFNIYTAPARVLR